ncbi:MAG: bacillithiol biosynthesis cysteine-adding enzyme BshC [Flavobacteriales bacterium]|nr:bacillithiol biosynthesis cysteine-adding enzyme BshC [Flavobacteriales bacterium]
MQPLCIPYAATHRFSPLVLDYLAGGERTREFHAGPSDLAGLVQAAAQRQFDPAAREVLVRVLRSQYQGLPAEAAVEQSLRDLARPDAFTVTTGHQLVLFGGPLYVPFKLLNTIRVARELAAATGRPVVPVFWMATEDHDRAEIDHTFFGDHKLQWPGHAGGAVGRMALDGITSALEEAIAHLGEGAHAAEMAALLREHYRPERTLAEATRRFVHALFGRFGLLVLDADHPELKRLFAPVVKEELLNQVAERSVSYANARLAEHFAVQAHAREINLFHLRPGHRSRIILEWDGFRVLDGGPTFTLDQLMAEVDTHPERFSPNVLLRPVYQEVVLPNVAYVGGGGELAYWLQLRWLFQALQVPMPRLILRTSAGFISTKRLRQWHALDLATEELFADQSPLMARVASARATFSADLAAERQRLSAFYDDLLAKASTADATLRGAVEARRTSALKGVDRIERSMVRAAKRQQDTAMARMRSAHAELFPGGGLQERRANILPMLAARGVGFLDELLGNLDPLSPCFSLFEEA